MRKKLIITSVIILLAGIAGAVFTPFRYHSLQCFQLPFWRTALCRETRMSSSGIVRFRQPDAEDLDSGVSQDRHTRRFDSLSVDQEVTTGAQEALEMFSCEMPHDFDGGLESSSPGGTSWKI